MLGVDVLDDAIRSLRIGGSVLLRETYAKPWRIEIPEGVTLSQLLGFAANTHVVAYHVVERGECTLRVGGHRIDAKAGEMLLCVCGAAHSLSLGKPRAALRLDEILSRNTNHENPAGTIAADATSLLCGAFLLHDVTMNPLFSSLPPVLKVDWSDECSSTGNSFITRMLIDEMNSARPAKAYIRERLLEILCAQAIRSFVATQPMHEIGWLRGVTDPVLGRALVAIHMQPEASWSVARLARIVSLSPSRFSARFAETLGESPMGYVARWRMVVARKLLLQNQSSIQEIAEAVGYDSSIALTRAFKRHLGVAPTHWRNSYLAALGD